MLHIVLLIIKIIGIVILALLGLLLLIFLTVMLIPVRYRLEAEHGEALRLEGRVGWLLHLVNARISYLEGKLHISIRVLCFTIFDNLRHRQHKILKGDHKRDKADRKSNMLRKEHKAVKEKGTAPQKPDKADLSVRKIKEDTGKTDMDEEADIGRAIMKTEKKLKEEVKDEVNSLVEKVVDVDHNIERMEEEGTRKEFDQKKEKSPKEDSADKEEFRETFFGRFYQKIISMKEKAAAFFSGIKRKIIRTAETVSAIKHKVDLISEFIRNELNKEGFRITYKSLRKLLRHVMPTKLKSRVVFGTGDPCSTGQALGIMGFLYGFYGDKVQIIPDFENKIFEGKHYARGRIRLVTILIIVIKLIVDKRFKRLKNNFQILKEAL